MLPELNSNQKVFIEITNPVHGGNGWEFGTCLWSPVYNVAGQRSWERMTKISPSDIIIHLLDDGKEYRWAGVSTALAAAEILDNEPPKADRWSGRTYYYRVDLTNFQSIDPGMPIGNFFKDAHDTLLDVLATEKSGRFYVHYKRERLQVAQGYLFELSRREYELFSQYSNKMAFDYSNTSTPSILPTSHEPAYPDMAPPAKVTNFVTRTVRDTKLSRDLKNTYQHVCQVCGKTITLPNGNRYAEGHHLQPLGSSHKGLDLTENIMILCPFHHTEFDYGAIAIDPETLQIVHIDKNNPYHDCELTYHRPDLGKRFIAYHFNNIFAQS